MANEFKIRKGLIVEGASGGTVVDVQGSQGQLFSVTDDLSGSIFAVSDISGVPIFDVNSNGTSYFDGNVGIGTTNPQSKLQVAQNMTAGTTAAFTSPHLSLRALNTTDNTGFVGMTFATSDNTNYGWSWGALRTNGGLGDMVLRNHYNSAQGTEKMRITSAGTLLLRSGAFPTNQDSPFLYRIGGGSLAIGSATETGSGAHIALYTNSSERMRIDSSGDVQLQTVGAKLRFQNSAGPAPYIKNSGEDSSTAPYGQNLEFYTGGSKRLTLDNSGNATFSNNFTTNGTATFYHGSTTHKTVFGSGNEINTFLADGSDTTMYLNYSSGATNIGRSTLVVENQGNVGIGTTNPETKLHVESGGAGDADGTCVYLHGDTATNHPVMRIDNATGGNGTDTHGLLINNTAAGAGLRINNASTTALIVKANGNVGIGTTNPQRSLQLRSTNQSTGIFLERTSNYGFVQYNEIVGSVETYHLGFVNNNTFSFDILVANESGNVGIGTSTPNAKLDIQGTQGQLFSVTDDLSGDIFSVADISGVPIMNVNSDGTSYFDGDVGIGINNPSYKLDVWGNGIALGSAAFAKYDSSNDLFLVGDWDGAGADMAIYDGNSDEVIRVTDGKVGIGTDNPSSKLSIRKNGAQLSIQREDALGTEWKFYSWASGLNIFPVAASEIYIGRDGATTNLQLHNGILKVLGTGDSYFTGDVGIGVTSPSAKLHVNIPGSGTVIKATGIGATIEIASATAGNATLYQKPNVTGDQEAEFRMTGGSAYGWSWKDDNATVTSRITYMKLSQGNSSLSVKGDVIAYGSPSDKRYKENIKPIESALDKAVKLQGVTFDWKESDSILNIKEDIGFIAQDVQKVVPELVRENKDGKLSLRYQGITPILLEAIKELKAEIDLLKSKPCNCNNCNCNI